MNWKKQGKNLGKGIFEVRVKDSPDLAIYKKLLVEWQQFSFGSILLWECLVYYSAKVIIFGDFFPEY